MARPIRDNLKYFPFDVDFFEDKKIRALKGRYGSDGVISYIYVLCQIYKDKGYYAELTEDFILCMSDDLNLTEGFTRQVLKYLLSRSLLLEIKDSTLAKPVTIITSKSAQKRYQEAMKSVKRDVFVKAEYWVLEKSETLGFIKVYPDEDKSGKNVNKSEKNNDNSTINDTKKKKENKRKLNDFSSSAAEQVKITNEQYNELVSLSSESSVRKYINKITSWQNENGKTVKNPYEQIKKWITEDKGKNNYTKSSYKTSYQKQVQLNSQKQHSYDLSDFEELALNFNPNKKRQTND